MTIVEINISAYGQLADVAIGDLGHPIVCIVGPNEAGKSTLFSFVQTQLFGFETRRLGNHEYAPASGSHIAGSLTYLTNDKQRVTVTRKLDSSPSGRVDVGAGLFHSAQDVENRPAPDIKGVDAEMFREVFALDLADMIDVDAGTWTSATDGLLGNLGFERFRQAAEVVSSLRDEANQLWRADRRGKPKSKQLMARINELKREISVARKREQDFRATERELQDLEEQIAIGTSELSALDEKLQFARKLNPIVKLDRKVRALRLAAQHAEHFDDLPLEPTKWLAQASGDLADLDRQLRLLRDEEKKLEETLHAFTDNDRRLLASSAEFAEWRNRITQSEVNACRYQDKVNLLVELEDELEERCRILGFPRAELVDVLDTVDEAKLERIARTLDSLLDERIEATKQSDAINEKMPPASSFLSWGVAALLGIATVIVTILSASGTPVLLGIGGLLLFVSLVRLFLTAKSIRMLRAELARWDTTEINAQIEEHKLSFARELPLSAIPDKPGYEEQLKKMLGIRETADRFRKTSSSVTVMESQLESVRNEFKNFARANAVGVEGSLSDAYNAYAEAIRIAETKLSRYTVAQERISTVKNTITDLVGRKKAVSTRKELVEQSLADAGNSSIDDGVRAVQKARKARQDMLLYEKELAADYPESESLLADARNRNGSLLDADQQERAALEMERRRKKLGNWQVRYAQLSEHLNTNMNLPQVTDLRGELVELTEQLDELKFRRDQLALMAEIIESVDLEFKERVEPELLGTTADYIRAITGGRYRSLMINDESELVLEDDQGAYHLVDYPLSRGIQDQVFLCLRFALADRLDHAIERLPMMLDEVFVNWDLQRRKKGYSVLRKVSEKRQVFLFTCHDWLADELLGDLGVKVVRL